MKERILTALVLICFFVPLYFYISLFWFAVLTVLLGYGMLVESYAMTFGRNRSIWLAATPILIVLAFYALWSTALYIIMSNFSEIPAPWAVLVILIFILPYSPFIFIPLTPVLFIFRVISMFQKSGMFCTRGLYLCQVLDIILFSVSLMRAFFLDKILLFKVLCIVVGIDSIGYFVGKFWGSRHIFPTISPNKTLEGYFAGLVWTIVFGSIILIPMELSILGLTLSLGMVYLLAITGDLLVSYQKRLLDIKDSGTILPGHGGLLDRFDSWMFIPAFVCYLVMIN